ncbi:cbb3-type cytochrome oxidase subunit 3 [Elongatibacter sediminis]|uniref:Cbb3-type cytochrome c oxidase subunit 3 n=1 Tax=Elongatibacter sediminis TaxID=3119006 RepID=A0AAW9RDX0_9GAMM
METEVLGLDLNTLRGILLIVLMVAFFGIWGWAWSSKRKKTFHDASRLPLEEDEGEIPVDTDRNEEKE